MYNREIFKVRWGRVEAAGREFLYYVKLNIEPMTSITLPDLV